MWTLLKTLPAFLAAAGAAGAAVGATAGWHFVVDGFPLLWLDAIRQGVTIAALAAAGFLILFELAAWTAHRAVPARFATPLSAAVALAPLVAVAGYHLNRSWGVRPSQVFEPYALVRNLGFLTIAFLVYLAICFGLGRLRERQGGRRRGGLLLAATASVVLLLNAGVAAAFRAGKTGALGPDVILLLVDALRADHLSSYGYPRETTPAIDALAADGVLFRQAISHSTFTKSSIASLFTARYPYQHGLYWGNLEGSGGEVRADVLGDDELTLAETLRERGYLTAAWVQNSHLTRRMGFDQGFVTYLDHQGSIGRIHRLFRRWLRGPGRRYGFFAYLHYIDLHDPYRPPPPYDALFGAGHDPYAGLDLARWGAFLAEVRAGVRDLPARDVERLRALYDGQLRAIDDEIGRLLDELRRLGLYDDSLILLTSDHGDGFMEHGFISHSTTPYDELVRVPLIVKFPGGRFRGRAVDEQVRLVDVLPTVLDAVGSGRRLEVAGCSLLPLVEDPPAERDPGCARAVIEIAEDGGGYPIAAIRTGRYKYIHHELRDDELYDLAADPGERVNLAAAAPEVAEDLRNAALAVVAQRPDAGERVELDARQIEELKALGYLD